MSEAGEGGKREAPLSVGQLVVIPREPQLGVGRLERLITLSALPHARVLLYDDGGFVVRPLAEVAPCPPGVWQRH